jgi:DNA-directed RNA polymerase subunit RPC12/RpoP
MQVNCSACGGSLKLTDQWRETGMLRCPYCDAENLIPEEVLAPHDQRPKKPKDSNILHIRDANHLEFHIGPRGTTRVSKLMLTGLVLGCAFCTGAFLGGLYVNRLLWIAAVTFAWLSYVQLKQVVHPYLNHRRITIDADTFLYEQYDRMAGL